MTELRLVNNHYTESLGLDELIVMQGWNKSVVDAAVRGAHETRVRVHTPQDATGKFADRKAAREWYASEPQPPVVYSLAKSAIGGLIWFDYHKEPVLGAEVHFNIRMFEELRGRRYAGTFLEAAHEDFFKTTGHATGIWLTTDKQFNEDAIGLFLDHGYEIMDQNAHELTMLREPVIHGVPITPELDAAFTAQYNSSHDLNNL
jgi:hypothetical protein